MAQETTPSQGRDQGPPVAAPPSEKRVTKRDPGKRVSHKSPSKRLSKGK